MENRKGCDSKEMFANLKIGNMDSFGKYLNKYDVIHIDVQWFMEPGNRVDHIVGSMQKAVIKELKEAYADVIEKYLKY